MSNKRTWDAWYSALKSLANVHGESVADKDAWRESYDAGDSPEQAFFDEYPEHLDTHNTNETVNCTLEQAARGDQQDVARIARELQQSHRLSSSEALRNAREMVAESRKAAC